MQKDIIIDSLAITADKLEKAGHLSIAADIDRAIFLIQGRPNTIYMSVANLYREILSTLREQEQQTKNHASLYEKQKEKETVDLVASTLENLMFLLKDKNLTPRSAKIKLISYLVQDIVDMPANIDN